MKVIKGKAGAMLAAATILAASLAAGAQAAERAQPHSERWNKVYQLVLKWSPFVEGAYRISPRQWAIEMAPLLGRVDTNTLDRATAARTFDGMNNVLLSKPGAGTQATNLPTKSLGDIAADLTYVPVSPCRIADTRLAGGALAAGETRGFDVTAAADYSFQGGDASNCGVGAAGSFAAAALNITVVNPAAQGYITAFPYLTTKPLAATMAFKAGALVSSMTVIKLDQSPSSLEMSVYASPSTHVVIDIIGYFINPQATALECEETATTIVAVAAGGSSNAVAPACSTGYTQTATNCAANWDMPLAYARNGTCSAKNNSGVSQNLSASRTCCRVPGR
ncbi:hypothetical protein [Lysobacter fragariae]